MACQTIILINHSWCYHLATEEHISCETLRFLLEVYFFLYYTLLYRVHPI